MIEDNLQAMTELAQVHGIKVILCSITPVSNYSQRKQTLQRPPADILKLNAWIKEYSASAHATFADYYSALADNSGMLKQDLSGDGLHPNDKGYALMVPVTEASSHTPWPRDGCVHHTHASVPRPLTLAATSRLRHRHDLHLPRRHRLVRSVPVLHLVIESPLRKGRNRNRASRRAR